MIDPLIAARANAAAAERSGGVTIGIDAVLFVGKQVVHLKGIAFHAAQLTDADDFSLTTRHTPSLHHKLNGAGNLLSQGTKRDVVTGHRDHDLKTTQRVTRVVGVNGG